MSDIKSVFSAYSCYYDLLYRDKDYVSEVAYIKESLARYGITKGDLLEFGSGTGKHGRLLAEHGYQVTGIERSAEMVAQAQLAPGFTCQQGDICAVQLRRTFDAVLSLFHVVSYQITNEEVLAVFARAAEHLRKGGVFLFDVWYSPAVYAQQPSVRIKRMADQEVEITRIAEPVSFPNENLVNVNYTIFARNIVSGEFQNLQEIHPMRHFSLPEIDLLAQMCGFERIGAEEFLTGKQANSGTWGVCITLQKV